MKQALLVFLGGGLGSVLRFWLSVKLNNFESAIPYGTLLANVLGSLVIGIIFGYSARTGILNENHSLLLATGFCGGFTTFRLLPMKIMFILKEETTLVSFPT